MPGRKYPLITEAYYHVYNKTIDGKRPLENPRILSKMKEICWYNRSKSTPMCYADYLRASDERRKHVYNVLANTNSHRVSVLAYCFMPTHYHFLLRQLVDGGISMFVSQVQNSFTRYFNILKSRKGPLFLHRFQSRPIESEGDIKHLARYIHLNPYSCGYVVNVEDAFTYEGSSFLELANDAVHPMITSGNNILSYFDNDLSRYRNFVIQNAKYQKQLERHD